MVEGEGPSPQPSTNLAADAIRPGAGVVSRPVWLTRQVVSRPTPVGNYATAI